jgi:hypothetical protein
MIITLSFFFVKSRKKELQHLFRKFDFLKKSILSIFICFGLLYLVAFIVSKDFFHSKPAYEVSFHFTAKHPKHLFHANQLLYPPDFRLVENKKISYFEKNEMAIPTANFNPYLVK